MAQGSTEAGIVSVTVRYRSRDGQETEVAVNPNVHDAVFLSMEAVDQFLLPYYLFSEGFEFVAALRQAIQEELKLTGIVLPRHKRYCRVVLSLRGMDPADFEFRPE
jgi:hypothetical protein